MPRYRTQEVPEPATQRLYHGHDSEIWVTALSPDERVLAGGGDACDPRIHLWDVATGEVLGVLEGHEGSVTGLAFSPDGTYLYSTSHDGTLRQWDVKTRTLMGEPLMEFVEDILALAISPDGTLAVEGDDGTAMEGDVGTLHILPPEGNSAWLDTQPDFIDSLAFCADGNSLAAGMEDGYVRVFARTQGKWQLKREWSVEGNVWALAFTPDQKGLVLGTEAGRVYEVKLDDPSFSPQRLLTVEAHLRGEVRSVLFADETTLLVGQWNTNIVGGQRGCGRLAIVSWPGGELLRELNDFCGGVDSLHLLSRGRQLLTSKNRTPGLAEPARYSPALLDFGDVNLGRGEQPFFENAPWLQV